MIDETVNTTFYIRYDASIATNIQFTYFWYFSISTKHNGSTSCIWTSTVATVLNTEVKTVCRKM